MKLDSFERKFVFRVSRGLHAGLAAIVTLVLVGAVLLGLYSMSPSLKGAEPAKPAPPPPAVVTADDLAKILTAEKGGVPPAVTPSPEPVIEEATESADPQVAKLQGLIAKLRDTYFSEPDASWATEMQEVCVQYGWGQCYRSEMRPTKIGLDRILGEAMDEKKLDLPGRIAFFEQILETMPLVPNVAKSRSLAVRASADTLRAYAKVEPVVYTAVREFLQGGKKKKADEALTPPPDDVKDSLFEMILAIRKRGSKPEVLVAFIGTWNEVRGVFSPETRNDGVRTLYELIRPLHEDQVAATVGAVVKLVSALPAEDRLRGVQAYQRVLQEKMRSAQREYDRAMADYDSAMAEREVKYQEKVTAKKGIRRFAAMGVAGALLLIALVALVLCLLGIERNTRALEKIIASQMNQNN
jgi:hypothetical protein